MGKTTGGLPFPEGTDLVKDGDDSIKALADALEARGHGLLVQSEEVKVTFQTASGSIVFPKPFKAGTVPKVLAGGGSGSTPNNTLAVVSVDAPNDKGCTFHAVRVSAVGAATAWVTNGEQMNVVYIAIGVAP